MEYGDCTRRRLVGVLIGGVLAGGVPAVAGAITVPAVRDRSQQHLDQRASRDVARTARLVRADLLTVSAVTPGATSTIAADLLRRTAERTSGVRVLRIEPDDGRLRLLFEVRMVKTGTTLLGYQRSTVVVCYQQVIPEGPQAAVHETPCPPVEP